MRRVLLIGLSVLLCATPFAAAASSGALQLNMSPQYPQPGDTVTLTATDYSANPDSLLYVWSVNNSVVLQGIGVKSFVLSAGTTGSEQTVTVTTTQNGIEHTGTAIVRPAGVDMIWEGETSVPPFYAGRPLPNAQSAVTVLAVPHLMSGKTELDASSLIYSWKVNDVPVTSASGYGKPFFTTTPPTFGEPFTVSVHVETADGTGAAEGSATITPEKPRIVTYEDAALLGVRFEKTIPNAFPFVTDEVSFAAFPLFASNTNALSYQWTLDGTPFSVDPARPGAVTFRKTGSESGTHAITFSFTNPNKFLEHAATSFTLNF